MRRVVVEIADEAFDVIADLALRERREVRAQASVLLEFGGSHAGGGASPWRNGPDYDPLTSLGLIDAARAVVAEVPA